MSVACASLSWAQAPEELPSAENDSIVAELLAAHNQERAHARLPPLQRNAKLTQAAQRHAQDMAAHKRLSHTGSQGSTPSQRVEQQGYHYMAVAENIASGLRSPAETVRAWMESPHHRRNILGEFSDLGAARTFSEEGKPYWCVDFGEPIVTLDPAQATTELITRLNTERRALPMSPLHADPKLAEAAQAYARDLATHDTVRRKDGGRVTPVERVQQEGYRFREVSQTAVSGLLTAQAVVQALMERPSHKAIILGSFSEVGAGYATADDGTPYWGLIFGTPRE